MMGRTSSPINHKHEKQQNTETLIAATATHAITTCGFSSWNIDLYHFFQSGAGMAVVLRAAAGGVRMVSRYAVPFYAAAGDCS
jgi:hypothetical protein